MSITEFVDDADFQTGKGDVTVSGEDLVPETQAGTNCWIGTIGVTGGSGNVIKSSWWLIDYKWNWDHWEYRLQTEMEGIIKMKDKYGEWVTLKRYEAWEAVKTLGMFLAPDGNMQEQITYLTKKAKEFVQHVLGRGPRCAACQVGKE